LKNSDALKNFGNSRQQEQEINQDISENNSIISSGFKYLKALINRIWNGDFPKIME